MALFVIISWSEAAPALWFPIRAWSHGCARRVITAIPDLAVTCAPYQEEEYTLTDPVLLIEILSPSNQAETWTNVWAYTTIPSVREILIIHSTAIRAEMLRRDQAGNWPERTLTIDDGPLELQSIGLSTELRSVYRGTRLAHR